MFYYYFFFLISVLGCTPSHHLYSVSARVVNGLEKNGLSVGSFMGPCQFPMWVLCRIKLDTNWETQAHTRTHTHTSLISIVPINPSTDSLLPSLSLSPSPLFHFLTLQPPPRLSPPLPPPLPTDSGVLSFLEEVCSLAFSLSVETEAAFSQHRRAAGSNVHVGCGKRAQRLCGR